MQTMAATALHPTICHEPVARKATVRRRLARPGRSPKAVRRSRTLALLFVVLVAVLVLFFPRVVHTQGLYPEGDQVAYTVRAGDTLWEIAGQYAGKRDVREVIYQIQRANNLQTADIRPGQVLRIPLAPGATVAGR
jgi:nucleoid-associated protein YgaU